MPLCRACAATSLTLPQQFSGYRLIRILGKGGMGIVYQAVEQATGEVVALKAIRAAEDVDPAEVARFLREAAILQQLEHPHIVSFRTMGESGGQPFFVMDHIPGQDAAGLLAREGPLVVSRAVGLVCQLLEALAYAHERGFVHRDVKPANLLVTEEDGREMVRVLDFGLARAFQMSKLSGLTLTGQAGGTLPFLAPEQVTNFREARPTVDQFAAAATLYNLLTGQYIHDFPSSYAKRLKMVLEGTPLPLGSRRPDLPEKLTRAVEKALAHGPENRFPDVTAFREALMVFAS